MVSLSDVLSLFHVVLRTATVYSINSWVTFPVNDLEDIIRGVNGYIASGKTNI